MAFAETPQLLYHEHRTAREAPHSSRRFHLRLHHMAQGTKGHAPTAAPTPPNGAPTVNRKKQKRREKQAAKQAAEAQRQSAHASKNGVAPSQPPPGQPAPQYAEPELDDPAHYDDDGAFYSEDEDDHHYDHSYPTNGHPSTGYGNVPLASSGTGKKSRKKKRGSSAAQQPTYNPTVSRPAPTSTARHSESTQKDIWNTSTEEERDRIREFWLSLGEDERKSLVKIEKEAVLRKMKEQQKHSCSCTVCGRKRTAIEEELEVLYDAYYDELEQYANQSREVPMLHPVHYARRPPPHRRLMTTHPPPEHYDEPDDLSQGEEEDGDADFSNSEILSEEDYSSEDRNSLPPPPDADFLTFGNSLTVQGGILTVADDLLKNDGKKFIEMMEQLAERRMQREEEAQYQSHPGMYARSHHPPRHGPPPEEDDYDEEDDDDEVYDDGDYEDDDDEEEDETMTEEQRMEEGRRMFQIFAARMFEQRVLQAYREKVAAERQQKLLEELDQEKAESLREEARKAKEAQKRKEKKEKEKQRQAAKKAQKEAERAAKEAEARAAEEKRLEEQRKRKEEQKKKREAERKAQEEERQRKEAERLKRQQEERERQQENERKLREQKAQEKKAKEEARRKEREEREAKEKEAKERRAQEEKQRRERDAKAKEEKDRLRKEEQAAAAAKKASQPVAVPLPPGLLKQNSSSGLPSPHVTPALPKAPTPSRPRQSSQQDSHGSSPKTPQVVPGSSKSISPASQLQNPVMPKSILTKPPTTQQPTPAHHTQPTSPMPPLGPPPGMHGPPGMGIGMPPGLNGFPHAQTPVMPHAMPGPRHSMSHGMPVFPHQASAQNYGGFPPPGMHAPSPLPIARPFPLNGPPGFGNMPSYAGPTQLPGFGMGMPSHSRQTSGTFEKPNVDSPLAAPPAQPIQRPAPIQRPSSVKPHEDNKPEELSDVDEVANHLGSKALLDDAEDEPPLEPRRTSLQTHGSLRGVPLGFGFPEPVGQPRTDAYAPFGGSASGGGVWGTPPMPFSVGAPGWGNSPTSGMFHQPPMAGCPRHGEARLVWIRRLLCSVCKSLPPRQSSTDGFLDASEVLQHVDQMRNPNSGEPPISIQEIKEACDIFGDPSNGGGSLEYKEHPNSGQISHIKFVETSMPTTLGNAALGEIGSPVPGHSIPAGSGGGGFGARPFPGLGPVSGF